MPKSIYLTDDQYHTIVAAAKRCIYRVCRGRDSQLAQFVMDASNGYVPANKAGQYDELPEVKGKTPCS